MVDRWCYPVPQAMQRHTGSHLTPPAREPSPPTLPAATPAAEPAPSLTPDDTEVMPVAAAR